MSKRPWFWALYAIAILGVGLAGAELIASSSVPSWPARDLRPIPIESLRVNVGSLFAETPELIPVYNDWAVRDRPRSISRPPDVAFRAALVGDSFLEAYFIPAPLSALVEKRWADGGHPGMEAINLGIAATGPRQYYYRIKSVALALDPDVVVVFVYAGNDLMQFSFDDFAMPALVDELPVPSILGAVAPRANWLVANRFGFSEVGRNNKDIPGEWASLNDWAQKPDAEWIERVVHHMKANYYPNLSEDTIREVLSRGDHRLKRAAVKRPVDREFVAGWMLSGILEWETSPWDVPHDAAEAERMVGNTRVDETLSWLAATQRLVNAAGKQLIVALIPVGAVDPDYVEFWRPWPRYYSYVLSNDARHRRLAAALRQRGQPMIDLREDLDGIRGTYRLTDGHWTDRGTQIVADRVSSALLAARTKSSPASARRRDE